MKRLLIIFNIFITFLYSQNYNFINFNIDEGLNSSQIFSIVEAQSGHLYLATSGSGLALFDGKNFTYITARDGLAGNTINKLFIDSKNKLWVGTSNGLSVLYKDSIKTYRIKDGLIGNEINEISETSDGTIWIGTYSGISLFKNNTFYNNLEINNQDDIPILSIKEDKNNNVWIASKKGLYIYKETILKKYTEEIGLKDTWPTYIYEDKKNNIWIGTTKGLIKIINGEIKKSTSFNSDISIGHINYITEDNFSNLTAATDEGVFKFIKEKIINYNLSNGLPDNFIHCIYYDDDNNLWFGSDMGLIKFRHTNSQIFSNPKYMKDIWAINTDLKGNIILGIEKQSVKSLINSKVKDYFPNNKYGHKNIWTITKDNQSNLWFGTSKGLIKQKGKNFIEYNKTNGFVNDEINTIYIDSKNNLIIGCYWTGLYFFDGKSFKNYSVKDGLKYVTVYSIIEDYNGNYWFGTDTGLSFFDGKNFNNTIGQNYFEGYSIVGIEKDKHNNLWFATYGNGLISMKFNESDSTFSFDQFTINDGLNDNSVLFVKEHNNKLYFATNRGLNIIDLESYYQGNKSIISLSKKSDGFLGEECIQNSYYLDSDNTFWFATIKGLVKTDLETMLIPIKKPKIYLNKFDLFFNKIDSVKTNYDGIIDLSSINNKIFYHDENYISFNYSGVSLSKGVDLKYTYLLEGLDKEWSPLSDKQEVSYPNLDPGNYIFKVKAVINKNLFSDILTIPFTIDKPLWAKSWFLTSLVLFFIFILFWLYRLRVSSIERKNLQLENQIEERKIYEKKIEQSEKTLFTILEMLPVGMILINESKTISKINLYAKQIMEIDSDIQIIGKKSEDFFTTFSETDNTEKKLEIDSNILEGKLITNKGNTKFILLSIVPVVINNEAILIQVFIDNTAHKNAEIDLFESEKRFRQFIENATIGIYRTTVDGKILMHNDALMKMLGYEDKKEFYNIPSANIYFDSKRRDNFITILEEKGGVRGFEEIWKKRNGESIFIRESARAVKDIHNNIIYIEGIVEDVTKIKEYEQALINAREKAEYSEKLKTEFLAQMSHEIRTPINSILSYSSLLKSDVAHLIPEEYQFTFNMIDNGGRRLIRTIDSILNMSELQIGSYEINIETFDIEKSLLLLLNEAKIKAESKSLSLNFTNELNIQPLIKADNYSTVQLFDNIIDNAIKYTKSGSVDVKLTQKNSNQILVIISDTGIGIEEEFIPHLFSPFTQEEQGYKRKYEGNGLGLALVKKYSEINNFEIDVESKKDIGTTFIVKINITND